MVTARAERNNGRNSQIVAIGCPAEAGEALCRLLKSVAQEDGLAYLVVPYGSGQDAISPTRLAKLTACEVGWAADGERPRAKRVYVVPPRTALVMEGGAIGLRKLETSDGIDRVLDNSFTALAYDLGERLIGVLLGAQSTDGLRGLRAIKENGGFVLLQRPKGLRNAPEGLGVGLADLVLPLKELAPALIRFVRHPMARRVTAKFNSEFLPHVLDLLTQRTGVDFNGYKKNMVMRRIARRMAVHQMADGQDYRTLLEASAQELNLLFQELLIGVTRFFRDDQGFQLIRERVIPAMLGKERSDQGIRIWIAGCSTGEEAYSIAMLLHEATEALDAKPAVKIFATDVDKHAVEFASAGVYPASVVADLDPDRIRKFFVKKGDGYQVAKNIREMVIFAPHNLCKDPPFHRIDLVCCRNLLIYMQPALQKKILALFHFSLNRDGFLFLGISENLGEISRLFSVIDGKWKIYRKKEARMPASIDRLLSGWMRPRKAAQRVAEPKHDAAVGDYIKEILLQEFAPASLVVNEAFEIVHISGNVDRFIKMPAGKPTLNIIKMAPRELSVALGTGIRVAFREEKQVAYNNITYSAPDQKSRKRVRLTIRPLAEAEDLGTFVLVIFEGTDPLTSGQRDDQTFDIESQAKQRISDLEQEVEHARENLQATIEELETSNEELQATNEEILASNEELQSTNEELQSVNEELYTVNTEHQNKIMQLTELNNDITNFLGSTSIGTIFLDEKLAIRKFTPAVTAQINLLAQDIGRPIDHISNNLQHDKLVDDAREVLKTLVPIQKEVRGKSGRWYIMSLMPYRTGDNVIKGVVISFVDITEVKAANESLRKLWLVIEHSTNLVMITDSRGTIEYVNQAFVNATGWSVEEAIGQNPRILKSGMMPQDAYRQVWETISGGSRWEGRFCNRTKNGDYFYENAIIMPMRDGEGRIVNFMKTGTLVNSPSISN